MASADPGGRSVIPPAALIAHQRAVEAGEAAYIDPDTGYLVFTAVGLEERGYCCGNGCRHCPYPPDEQACAGRPGSGPDDNG